MFKQPHRHGRKKIIRNYCTSLRTASDGRQNLNQREIGIARCESTRKQTHTHTYRNRSAVRRNVRAHICTTFSGSGQRSKIEKSLIIHRLNELDGGEPPKQKKCRNSLEEREKAHKHLFARDYSRAHLRRLWAQSNRVGAFRSPVQLASAKRANSCMADPMRP